MSDTHEAYIAFGSNIGDRRAHIDRGLRLLDEAQGLDMTRRSPIFETEPIGPGKQSAYLNGVVEVRTSLEPDQLLSLLLAIEAACGRNRSSEGRWMPRTLDLDLLFYDQRVIDEPGLTVPHPRLHERRFVLEPLASIAPQKLHPVCGETVSTLLRRLEAD